MRSAFDYTPHSERPPRRNAFPGICQCGTTLDSNAGWVWKGGVYCRFPSTPGQCPKTAPHD